MNQYADPIKLRELKDKANQLPLDPGVYIMKDKFDKIIYIGKAKALKNRVTQYFGAGGQHSEKVKRMVSNVNNFEYIICESEFEALILENSLIKQNQPKYNILLKDDKGYSYIKISKEKWPRISTSKSTDNTATFIGPYNSGYIVKETTDEARKIFKLPDCNRNLDIVSKPCLNYHIGICDAPCTGKIKNSEYIETVTSAVEFIKHGNTDENILQTLNDKMIEASDNLQFETAAKLRDRINAIKKIKQKQRVVESQYKSIDIIATVLIGEMACVEIIIFRNYRLTDKQHYFINGVTDRITLYEEFLQQYYIDKSDYPQRILIDTEVSGFETIEKWITSISGHKVLFVNPKQGQQKELLDMCITNASENISEKTERTGREMSILNEITNLLGLESAPRYIEAYDISNTSGSENVAGMIVYKDGRPFRQAYKRFKIKSFEGQDDFRSMAEVLDRRFIEYEKKEDEGFSRLPDLILLDGGIGQMTAVIPVLNKHNINVPLFGMVKDSKHRTRAIASNGGDITIKSNRSAFTFVTGIQNEVHRFAIGYHKSRRSKAMFNSELKEIKGIGNAKAAVLLKYFKTITGIKNASLDELDASGIGKEASKNVYNHFHC